MTRRVANN